MTIGYQHRVCFVKYFTVQSSFNRRLNDKLEFRSKPTNCERTEQLITLFCNVRLKQTRETEFLLTARSENV